ncbi:MAG: MinD/ParA family protein [Thermodesulfobacteriota bacterium]
MAVGDLQRVGQDRLEVDRRVGHVADPVQTIWRWRASRGGPYLRSMAITSGKGGVGKTSLTANLALLLCDMGVRTLVLDADAGLANIDVLLGLSPKLTLKDFIAGDSSMEDIVMEGPGGMKVVPAGSGVLELTHLDRDQRLRLNEAINGLAARHDLLLIDTPAGVSSNVLHFNAMSEEIMVVVTPEPTSLTDAYALVKLMVTKHRRLRFSVLVNAIRSQAEGEQAFWGLNQAAERFLGVSLVQAGCIPWDPSVPRSVRSQEPFVRMAPTARATESLRQVAARIMEMKPRQGSDAEVILFGPYS